MHLVVDNLYLGNIHDAYAHPDDVDVIINCTKDIPFFTSCLKRRACIRIPVDDDLQAESMDIMYAHLSDAVTTIRSCLRTGNKVLVHCYAGQQRSAAVIAAYLMKTYDLSLKDTVTYMRTRKRDAFLYGVNFERALRRYEKEVLGR